MFLRIMTLCCCWLWVVVGGVASAAGCGARVWRVLLARASRGVFGRPRASRQKHTHSTHALRTRKGSLMPSVAVGPPAGQVMNVVETLDDMISSTLLRMSASVTRLMCPLCTVRRVREVVVCRGAFVEGRVTAQSAARAAPPKQREPTTKRTLGVPDLQRLAADAVQDGHEARLVAVAEHGGWLAGCWLWVVRGLERRRRRRRVDGRLGAVSASASRAGELSEQLECACGRALALKTRWRPGRRRASKCAAANVCERAWTSFSAPSRLLVCWTHCRAFWARV